MNRRYLRAQLQPFDESAVHHQITRRLIAVHKQKNSTQEEETKWRQNDTTKTTQTQPLQITHHNNPIKNKGTFIEKQIQMTATSFHITTEFTCIKVADLSAYFQPIKRRR